MDSSVSDGTETRPVGAGLPAKTAAHSTFMSSDTLLSRASRIAAPPLPQGLWLESARRPVWPDFPHLSGQLLH
ncbi:hypothetical protein DOZ80_20235 [Pseudomonas fluorescens]|uniref:Uncharacterized protein n=1 Tax=Pseudomonas fluorescens TaxID=294 RepID=A0A327MYT0_PSEFL|nr:hypothetical protein DOZ80_20235 [Pseudomonas fluorescens]